MAKSNQAYSAISGFFVNLFPFIGYAINENITANFSDEDLSTYASAAHAGSIFGGIVSGFSAATSALSLSPVGALAYGVAAFGEYENYTSVNEMLHSHHYIGNIGIIDHNDYYHIHF